MTDPSRQRRRTYELCSDLATAQFDAGRPQRAATLAAFLGITTEGNRRRAFCHLDGPAQHELIAGLVERHGQDPATVDLPAIVYAFANVEGMAW